MGLTHGDLSAFNILATEERMVIIDLPAGGRHRRQPAGHGVPGPRLPQRRTWFTARGLEVDAEALLGDLIAYAW